MLLDDPARLDALRSTGLLDAPPDATFDRFTRLAQLSLDVPIALISLVDDVRQFFTSHVGLPEPWATERVTPLSLCGEVARSGEPLVLDDVRDDPVRAASPVARALEIAGFAGIPLVSAEGYILGALCAIDHEAREWTAEEIEILTTLAAAVSARLQLLSSAERNARLAEDKQAILESSLDCILVMDHTGSVREWNPAAERTFGWSREEAVGRRLGDLIVPVELRARHEEGLRRAVETGESRVLDQRLRLPALRRDGTTFSAELTITKVDREGHPLFTGTIRDITDVVRAEDELRAAELRYRTVVEEIPLATYRNVVGPRPATVYISPQIEELLGYPVESWLGEDNSFYETLVHAEDVERVTAECEAAHAAGHPFHCEYRMLHRDGRTVWVLDRTSIVRNEDGEPLYAQGFLLDITERKELEEQLRQSQKMEAIGQLAGGIAHDFNNMLTAISGYTELLAASFDAGDRRSEDVEQIRKAADHAAALTRQLLAFSRKQVLRPQRLDVNDVVHDLERMLLRTLGEDVRLRTALDEAVAPVEADPDQLVQVLLNIAINARDAMPEGGSLTIATRQAEREERPFVVLEVSDTGTGMDDLTRSRIFEPFFTTKAKGKGTGLGLATAHGVVDQSGGRIEVETAPGEGATFRILLPAA